MKLRHLLPASGLLCTLLLNACGFLKEGLTGQPVAPENKHTPQVAATKPAINKNLLKKQEINRLIEGKDFPAALAMVGQEVGRGTSEKDLKVEYVLALNGVIDQAQALLAEKNPSRAGVLFRAALDNYPKDAEVSKNAGLVPPELKEKIELCADQLMGKGLIAYRAGKLETAIEEWKKALVFQPGHRACQKAIQTAELQLLNLKKINADK